MNMLGLFILKDLQQLILSFTISHQAWAKTFADFSCNTYDVQLLLFWQKQSVTAFWHLITKTYPNLCHPILLNLCSLSFFLFLLLTNAHVAQTVYIPVVSCLQHTVHLIASKPWVHLIPDNVSCCISCAISRSEFLNTFQTNESNSLNADTLDFRWSSCFVNRWSVRLIWKSSAAASMVCCMRIRFSVKGGTVQGGEKIRQGRSYSNQKGRCDGRGKERAIRSGRWQNNMTSHWASLRLAPLRGSVVRQRAANDVLKVKPCAGLMGQRGQQC